MAHEARYRLRDRDRWPDGRRCLDDGEHMIAFVLLAILAVIFWPLALLIALAWATVLVLRICFGITVLGLKATAATGVLGWMATSKLAQHVQGGSWYGRWDVFNRKTTKMSPPGDAVAPRAGG